MKYFKAATVHYGLAACKSTSDLTSRIEGFIIIISKLAGSPHGLCRNLFTQSVDYLRMSVKRRRRNYHTGGVGCKKMGNIYNIINEINALIY